MKEFFDVLNSIYPLSIELQEHLLSVLKSDSLERKKFFT